MEALISECEQYRYFLKRLTNVKAPTSNSVLFVMLNPSTADATVNDPTIRRCIAFAESWSYTELIVANLYALRATNPKELLGHVDPVGPDNDSWLQKLLSKKNKTVCAWGGNADLNHVENFLKLTLNLEIKLCCLGTTKAGAPRHPLYVKGTQQLTRYVP